MSSRLNRKTWDRKSMKIAYLAVKNKEMGYLKASKLYGVPKSTLEDYVKSPKDIDELLATKLGRKPTFDKEIEEELVEYCLEMVKKYYGLRANDIKHIAFELAVKNNIPHQFSHKGQAGKKWLASFLKRHPQLAFRTPEATTALRARGFTMEKVTYFFDDILGPEMEKINYDPMRIFNVDETGVTVVQKKMAKVICLKGQKQVGGITSAERGALVTLVFCMGASGIFVPPLFIFPRVNMKRDLEDGAPPGSKFDVHKSGWIQLHIFAKWFQHFVDFVKPCKEKPVILLLDGHYSHTRNIDVIDLARENGVILISIPPHTSHRLQPLDVGFMGPFKKFYHQEIESWLRSHPGRVVTAYQVSELVGKAFLRAQSAEIAVNSFRKCGIIPFNKNVFRDEDFAVEDSPGDISNASEATINDSAVCSRPSTPQPSTSGLQKSTGSITTLLFKEPAKTVSKLMVSPEIISPIPAIQRKPRINSRETKPTVLSSSPYKTTLEAQIKKRDGPLTKKRTAPAKKTKEKKKMEKNKVLKVNKEDVSDSEDSEIDMILESDGSEANDDDAECTYCNMAFSTDSRGERWIRCLACRRWCHEECAGVEDHSVVDFVCDLCLA